MFPIERPVDAGDGGLRGPSRSIFIARFVSVTRASLCAPRRRRALPGRQRELKFGKHEVSITLAK